MIWHWFIVSAISRPSSFWLSWLSLMIARCLLQLYIFHVQGGKKGRRGWHQSDIFLISGKNKSFPHIPSKFPPRSLDRAVPQSVSSYRAREADEMSSWLFQPLEWRQQGEGLEVSVKEWTLSGTRTKMRNRKVKSELLGLALDILDWIILSYKGLPCVLGIFSSILASTH